jgi:predicted NBD/HSP70 family sugar kinase
LGYLPAVHDPSMGEVEARSGFRRPHLGMYFNLPRLYARLQAQGLDVSHPGQLETLYREGHADMLDWVDTGTQHLAPLILAIEYLIDPEAIFFGGRLPDVIIEGMMDRLDRLLPTLRIEGKPSVPALLNATAGADAAALGVATLPLYASFAPAPAILMKRGDADGTFSLVPGA